MKLLIKNKIRLLSIFFILIVASISTFTIITATADVNREISLPEKVNVGEVVEIPVKTLNYNSESKQAEIYITKPRGGVYSGKQITADQAGKYIVEYVADFNGHKVTETESFLCYNTPKDLFITNQYATATNGTYSIVGGVADGVHITSSAGGEIEFAQTIDLNSATKDDVLLELIVDPFVRGKMDIEKYTIYITDVEDEENQLILEALGGETGSSAKTTGIKAAAPGQVLTGRLGSQDSTADGPPTVTTYATWGAGYASSFVGESEKDGELPKTLKIYYDNETKQLLGNNAWHYYDKDQTIIADLDDPVYFPRIQWEGFTSGKVRISFTMSGFTGIEGRILFSQIGGVDLSVDEYVDDIAPELTIDYGEESAVPEAVLGADYKIFAASVSDNFDQMPKLDVSVKYYDFDSKQMCDVMVENGAFKTNYPGTYYITYTASDNMKNVREETVVVKTRTQREPINIEFSRVPANVDIGEEISVATATASGGSGKLTIKVEVFDPDNNAVSLSEANTFFPNKAGYYTVRYQAKDYLGHTGTTAYRVNVKVPEYPVFFNREIFPKVLINGFTYDFPDSQAYEFIGEANPTPVQVIKLLNGQQVIGNTFIAEGNEVTVTYKAIGSSGNNEYSYTIPVVNGNNTKDQTKYFYGSNFTTEYLKESVRLTFSQDTSILFANPVSSRSFYIRTGIYDGSNFFDRYEIKLTDYADPLKSVTMIVKKVGEEVTLTLPNGKETKISGSFVLENKEIGLQYNYVDNTIKDSNGSLCGTIFYFDDGKEFTGFSDTVWVEIAVCGVTKESKISFIEINNQPLGYRRANVNLAKDDIPPEIYVLKDSARVFSPGDSVIISNAVAFDVLSQIDTLLVTVKNPEGVKIVDQQDASKMYEITLETFGVYSVTYEAKDKIGKTATIVRQYHVLEREKPVVTVGKMKTDYKVGTTVYIPEIDVSDNSGSYTVCVMFIRPDHYMEMISYEAEDTNFISKPSFKVDTAGEWTIRIFVYDSTYNYTIHDIKLNVE